VKVRKASHCAYQTHYHIVFPVKYRKALLDKRIEKKILDLSKKISERYEIDFEQIGCDKNHIHILCSFHPKYSIGEMVRTFKSITAREIFKTFPEVKQDLWGGEFWTDGYYVATVGERGNWEVVKKYVKNQGNVDDINQLRLF
tara:strand:+ start:111 stop:539 length:429 start_codon:yes stop_codon:yes gene_type:complete